jgi:hypothetical protein
MDKKTKIILAAVAGIGLVWWWNTQGSSQTSLAAHMPATPVVPPSNTGSSGTEQVVSPAIATSGGSVAISPVQVTASVNGQMIAACLAWSQETKNPALYAAWINQLSASDLTGLYNLVTTYWAGTTASPTAAQTAFWNNLRAAYPFLNVGGVGCNNFQCD